MENGNSEKNANISMTEVLSLVIIWTAILLIVKFFSSPGVVVLGLAAGYYLSKIIILKQHEKSL
jgi:phosphatidylserine synthase